MNWNNMVFGAMLLSGVVLLPGCKGQEEHAKSEVSPWQPLRSKWMR